MRLYRCCLVALWLLATPITGQTPSPRLLRAKKAPASTDLPQVIQSVPTGNQPCNDDIPTVIDAITTSSPIRTIHHAGEYAFLNDTQLSATVFVVPVNLQNRGPCDAPIGQGASPALQWWDTSHPPAVRFFALTRTLPGRYCIQDLLDAGTVTVAEGVDVARRDVAVHFFLDEDGYLMARTPNTTGVYVMASHDVCGRSIVYMLSGELWPPPWNWGFDSWLPAFKDFPNIKALLPENTTLAARNLGVGPTGCDPDDNKYFLPLSQLGSKPAQVCSWPDPAGYQGPVLTNSTPTAIITPDTSNTSGHVTSSFSHSSGAVPLVVVILPVVLGTLLLLASAVLLSLYLRRRKRMRMMLKDGVKLVNTDVELGKMLRNGSNRPMVPVSITAAGERVGRLEDLLIYAGLRIDSASSASPPMTLQGSHSPDRGPPLASQLSSLAAGSFDSSIGSVASDQPLLLAAGTRNISSEASGEIQQKSVTTETTDKHSAAARLIDEIAQDMLIQAADIQVVLSEDGLPHRIGSGGAGTVYRGMLLGVTPVALKLPGGAGSAHNWGNRREQLQLLREIMALRELSDPHILQYLGVACMGNNMVLVTEFCAGGDLSHALTGPQKEEFAWEARGQHIAYQVLQALVYLHSKNRAHLDLKPQNVLLDSTGTHAKVCDLGMSVLVAATAGASVTNLGTFAYAAPELLLGSRVTTQADMYSFGVLLWQLLTQESPQRGALSMEGLDDLYPPALLALLSACLSPAPALRPSAREAASRLAFIIMAACAALNMTASESPEEGSSSHGSPPMLQHSTDMVRQTLSNQMDLLGEAFVSPFGEGVESPFMGGIASPFEEEDMSAVMDDSAPLFTVFAELSIQEAPHNPFALPRFQ